MLANRVRMATFKDSLPEGYVLATDDDFSGTSNGDFRYIGSALKVAVPSVIKGVPVTSYIGLFTQPNGKLVEGVVSNNTNVTDMKYMFNFSSAITLDLSNLNTSNVTDMSYMLRYSRAITLDLSGFNTSNVTDMSHMFRNSAAIELNLNSFNTSNVTNMGTMFHASEATTLDLSSFDTSNVTDMSYMFNGSKATTLDLSSFDTSNVTDMSHMFSSCAATIGYARTQADADRFNATSGKPAGLTFIVKP